MSKTILDEAAEITAGDRNKDYGHPADNHTCTAEMFRAFIKRKYRTEVPFDAEDVCVFNVLQKLSRDANLPKRDNLVDGAGYLRNIEMIRERSS